MSHNSVVIRPVLYVHHHQALSGDKVCTYRQRLLQSRSICSACPYQVCSNAMATGCHKYLPVPMCAGLARATAITGCMCLLTACGWCSTATKLQHRAYLPRTWATRSMCTWKSLRYAFVAACMCSIKWHLKGLLQSGCHTTASPTPPPSSSMTSSHPAAVS